MQTPSPVHSPVQHQILDGRRLASRMYDEVAEEARTLTASGSPLSLVSVSVGSTAAARLYVRNQQRVAERVGIRFEDRAYPETMARSELLSEIVQLNEDPAVTGVIIQRPVPSQLSIRELQSAVSPLKDVEGMNPASIGNIVYNETVLAPCTSVAAVELLRTTGLQFQGLEVVVIGHSEIVGKPVAFLMIGAGATVTVCHHMTRNLLVHSRKADAVFVAVGKPRLITSQMIKPGAALIDIGINQIDTPEGPKVVGDIDYESCSDIAGWITPVPGGVGPVTVAVLMRNTVRAAKLQRKTR